MGVFGSSTGVSERSAGVFERLEAQILQIRQKAAKFCIKANPTRSKEARHEKKICLG